MPLLSRVLNQHAEKKHDKSEGSGSSNHHKPLLSPTMSQHHLSGLASSSTSANSPSLTMSINVESPPIILYGQPHESSGSIISGLFLTTVSSHASMASLATNTPPPFEEFELESVTLLLVQTIRYTRPFLIPSSSVNSCKDCSVKKNVLARWDVLTLRTLFSMGTHAYPFSHLLPGSLPASSKIGSIHSHSYVKYDLIAVAKSPNSSKDISVKLPLNISRSILRGPDRNSLRVFPPTEIKASAVLPSVVYPKSSFPIELKLDNIVSNNSDRRWRMRKLNWRIEEHIKIKADTCAKHQSKLNSIEESQKKVILHRDKSSGLHHSTIQTNMFLSTCPSAHLQSQIAQQLENNENTNPEHRDIDIQEENPEVIQPTGPANELRNFVEDFIAPVNSNNSSISNNNINNGETTEASSDPFDSIDPAKEELYLDELRTINHGEIKSGWKSDFSGRGRIELVADISAINSSTGLTRHVTKKSSDDPKTDDHHEGLRNGANIACDIDDPSSGIYINHTLIIEVVVAEELISANNTNTRLTPVTSASSTNATPNPVADSPSSNTRHQSHPVGTPTGAARVLRMQFKVIFTERSGLGIAWDDEVPPTYEDVRTLSPPTYQETSGTSTPNSLMGSSFLTPPPMAAHRSTPGVIYGIGDTPVYGTFDGSNQRSIDGMVDLDERIQEFTL
ncbi:hypothetical protein HYPBUDRAFT_127256 [Hyphopichia burtonii NRRL Y-1933]|uniref:LDB19 N-terminal domain-containing protein n=1 Tax=Hyphopichia burtonii NRRL Y-1933 TaxID=984485 RepID=A0A1E4RFJ2_9ASCO|nr:hypothetical protein HYPBUDRAFT_127256 [Hyphopichia burtonii NRRL Y-1933]ODV66020.1 hypothetical protein HYPBUDRAFT_127256 [Hyphopichia burtonii NRRL Y-1933]